MRTLIRNMERYQVALYLASIVGAAVVGLAAPGVAVPAELAVQPALGLLLYSTFLGIPFEKLREAARDRRFLAAVLALNFLLVPIVVFALSRFVVHDQALLVGVLFVLLAPCIDYVIVFTGLAGGAHERLLAATPLLMLAQMILLPLYLWWFTGSTLTIEPAPFLQAFIFLVAVPLAAAALTQFAARRFAWARTVQRVALTAMVPLMMITLAAVVASQISGVREQLSQLLITVPIFLAFAAVMVPVGILVGRIARIDASGTRALVFSGATRNSLVILPLALALPSTLRLVPLVVVTQTLVELLVMVIFVRLIPRVVGAEKGLQVRGHRRKDGDPQH